MATLSSLLRRKPVKRAVRRRRRTERWARPLDTSRARLEAWFSLLVVDHGLLRLVYRNRHRVSPRLWRSAQPTPGDLSRAARRGARTVISLRHGQDIGAWPLERDACARAGLDLVVMPLFSRDLPTVEMLREVDRIYRTVAYPALVHCKSGADRAGLAAALYLLIAEGRPVAEARRQLSWRYGHVKHGKTGVLDAFLDHYEREGETRGLTLMEWAESLYDREAVRAAFRSTRWGNFLTERLLDRE